VRHVRVHHPGRIHELRHEEDVIAITSQHGHGARPLEPLDPPAGNACISSAPLAAPCVACVAASRRLPARIGEIARQLQPCTLSCIHHV